MHDGQNSCVGVQEEKNANAAAVFIHIRTYFLFCILKAHFVDSPWIRIK